MITEVEIYNFQSHRHTKLSLTQGTNIFIGQSDSGKSAIIRALKWVIFNQPSGDAFRSTWGGDTKVIIRTSEGHEIIRLRTNSKNMYILDDSEFSALSGQVPEEIQKVLGIEDVNFQAQLDSPFLLSQPAGQIAQYFNQVADLDNIDAYQKSVNSAIRDNQQRLKHEREQLASKKEELRSYNFVKDFEQDVSEADEVEQKRQEINGNYTQLYNIVKSVKEVDAELTKQRSITKASDIISEAIKINKEKQQVDNSVFSLSELINKLRNINTRIDIYKNLQQAKTPVNEVLKYKNDVQEINKKIERLQGLKQRIEINNDSLINAQKEYKKLHKQYHEEFPDVCPLCGKKQES